MRPRKPRAFNPAMLNDPAIRLIIAILAELPRSALYDNLVLLDFLRSLPRRSRAAVAKCVQPDLTDEAAARIAGVKPDTLATYHEYQAVKGTLADYLEPKRRQSYLPAELDA